ncbi:hypothetical protein NL676_026213 [Syzygium grande]|nr:hypothetical protein NL676_026213 [Syzygium grande]
MTVGLSQDGSNVTCESHLGSLVLNLGLGSTSIFRQRKLELLLRMVADEDGKVGGEIEMDSREGDLQSEEDGGMR